MSKRIAKPAKVSPKANPFAGYLAALQQTATLVNGFQFVQNPATQFSQRPVREGVKVKVMTPEAKTPLTIDLPAGYLPARRMDKGKAIFDKSLVRALLAAYSLGQVSNPKTEAVSLAAYLGFKVMTSRPRSLEGALSANVLSAIESACGIKVESVGESTREAIEERVKGLQNFMASSLEGGFLPAVRGRRKYANVKQLGI